MSAATVSAPYYPSERAFLWRPMGAHLTLKGRLVLCNPHSRIAVHTKTHNSTKNKHQICSKPLWDMRKQLLF